MPNNHNQQVEKSGDIPFILSSIIGTTGIITLSRPHALNALSYEMVTAISSNLNAWAIDASIEQIILESSDKKIFCAGGDIKEVAENKDDFAFQKDYFYKEYRLNQLIKNYPKPIIAIVDGLALGGGVGISLHAQYSVITPQGRMGMPETTIGFFPDVGASYFMNRAPFPIALYMGLTGLSLLPYDIIKYGWGTNYTKTDTTSIKKELIASPAHIKTILDQLQSTPPEQSVIDETLCQKYLNLQDIKECKTFFMNLFNEQWTDIFKFQVLSTSESIWLQDLREKLINKSPTSLLLTYEMLHSSRDLTLEQAFNQDFHLALSLLKQCDFYEGVRALIIDKDKNPVWSPNNLKAIDETTIIELLYQAKTTQLFLR